jgi:hypothetical protein
VAKRFRDQLERPTVLAGITGLAAAVLALTQDSWWVKVGVGTFFVAMTVAWVLASNKQDRENESASQARHGEIIRAVTAQATARNRVLQVSARELVSEIRDFLIPFDRERPRVNVTLAGTERHMEFIKQIADGHDHDSRVAAMAADRFSERLKLTVIDLRNSGVLDPAMAAEAFYKYETTLIFRQLGAAIEKAADLL